MSEHKNKSRASVRPLDLRTLALTSGGLGFLRPAPGTWGSLPPVLIAGVLMWLGTDSTVIFGVMIVLMLAASLACIAFGVYAESRFGRKDAAEVVADETAGVCLPVLVVLLLDGNAQEISMALTGAFVLFRLFDISKPWPMKWLEERPFGWGVLLDDLVAGVYAAIVLMLIVGFLT